MQLGAGVSLLVLALLLSVGHVKGLTCFCNGTHNAPLPHCLSNFSCSSNYQCLIHRFWSYRLEKIVTEWECLNLHEFQPQELTIAYCNSGDKNNMSIVRCCNDTNYCNHGIQLKLPMETEGYRRRHSRPPHPLPSPHWHPTSMPARKEEESPLCLTVGVPLLTVISVVTLVSTPIIVLVILRLRRTMQQRKTRQQKTMQLRSQTSYIQMSVLCEEITSSTASGLPLLSPRGVTRKAEVGSMIANGRFARVFIGNYQGETVAIKKFNAGCEQAWCKEMEIYAKFRVQHENILQFIASNPSNFQEAASELWLVIQYHSNRSLFDYLQRGVVSARVMLQMVTSTCIGLAYLHLEVKSGLHKKPPIAHRNITSKNILVKDNLRCCIADFGLAVVKDGVGNGENLFPNSESLKDGTIRYMAPEVLNETINTNYFESFKQVDIYALGLVFWEICRRCTGKEVSDEKCEAYELPFQGLVPPEPSFEDMRKTVVVERRQPGFTNRWSTDEVLSEMIKIMRECWYFNSSARPTAAYFKKRLLKLSQEKSV